MSDRTAARLAWAIFALILAMFVGGLALPLIAECADCGELDYGVANDFTDYLFAIALLSFPLTGVMIASRQPRNRIGWLLLTIGLAWAITAVTTSYVFYGLITHPGSLPRPDIALAIDSAIWIPTVGLMGTFLILLFPDGKLPSPRWRPIGWLSGIALTLGYLLLTVFPGNFEDDMDLPVHVENPLGIEALRPFEWTLAPVVMLTPVCVVACGVAVIQRYRRSEGVQRLQMKWFAAATGITVTLYFVGMLASIPFWSGDRSQPFVLEILDQVALMSFVLIPIATGVAVLRYRLYDIDVIVNRALVYGSLTGILTVIYLLITALLQGVLSPIAGKSNVAVAASTLGVAALFRPARNRIQSFIDRRFYRRKYDANRTIHAFTARLREKVELEALTSDLVAVVGDVMQPAHVSVWLGRSRSE